MILQLCLEYYTQLFSLSYGLFVSAINMCPVLYISYPDSVEKQSKIAAGFEKASTPGINNCTRSIDGIFIWILKPSLKESKNVGVGQKGFSVGARTSLDLTAKWYLIVKVVFLTFP